MIVAQWMKHFGLSRAPFSKELADDELWIPSSREGVVASIVEACREHGHVLLTGAPAVGKTCVLRAVRRRLPGNEFAFPIVTTRPSVAETFIVGSALR